jgi:hypothetical protein
VGLSRRRLPDQLRFSSRGLGPRVRGPIFCWSFLQ